MSIGDQKRLNAYFIIQNEMPPCEEHIQKVSLDIGDLIIGDEGKREGSPTDDSGCTRPRQEVFENTSFGFVWALRQSQGFYYIFLLIPVFEYFLPGTSTRRR